MSNNPPDVLIALSLADAEMLLKDSEAAVHQLLGVINEADHDTRPEFVEKLCLLLEFKQNVKQACEEGIRNG